MGTTFHRLEFYEVQMLVGVLLCVSSPLQLDGVFASQASCTMTYFFAGFAAGADLLLLV